ncbi:MAG: DUF192 domain-containing protein [bacterium]|nr:DUF192 domain-containing protein [bacterium]
MLHDQEFIKIVRVRRRIFVGLFAATLVASVAISVKQIYFTKLDIPRMQTYQEVLQTYKKAVVHSSTGDTEFFLEPADTPKKRQEGLMFRESLAKNSGMLFIFDTDVADPFWMKNTLLPLDIFFVDAEYRIVDSATMEPCKMDPCSTYQSRTPYRYAIEVNQGFILEKKIRTGDTITF